MTGNLKKLLIAENNYLSDMEETVLPYLAAHGGTDFFKGYDGNPLRFARYRADSERGAVVICHGFTESCEKYDEMAYYFLKNNLSVYIPEHRGHGRSHRSVNDLTLTHIDRFEEYVDDLSSFISSVVRNETSAPLYLFAHSMGGAIGSLYLEGHPNVFSKAVLSSPMIAPETGGAPSWLAKTITSLFRLIGKGQERSFTSGEYPGYEKFEDSCAMSRSRFEYYQRKKCSTDYLQNYSPTYSWISEALGVTRKILSKGAAEKIRIPVLIFSAENDTFVRSDAQKKFAERLEKCKFSVVPGTKHEIFSSDDEVVRGYLEEIFSFLCE